MLLNEMEIFYYVVEFKSFSKAASRLKVSKSFISKKIYKLEHDLKVNLISRSTRKLTITEAGESFYRYCANIVHQGNEAYSMINELQGKPSGRLKISMPPALGLNLITPMLSKFLSQYPEISLDIELENKLVDLLEEGYDLALRSSILKSSNLIAQKIYSIKNVICATEKYLETHSKLNMPSDLEKHNYATYSYAKISNQITLTKNNRDEIIHTKGNLTSNHLDLIKQMVLDNFCIAILPEFMVKDEIKAGKIKLCLIDYQLPENPLYAVYQ
ncbi:MAG: LysR family transcriptional regulator, partial [Gammaproteobacteria bacterium]|nr:LysR family transcriptional regulator [Gammaproteobacteria bacterium]